MPAMLPVADPWFTVEAVEPGVYRITEPHCDRLVRANCFLVKGGERDLLVDSGMGIGRLRPALAALIDRPLILVTTHAHVDHRGGHGAFADAAILVHPAEADDLRRPGRTSGLGFDQFDPATRAELAAAGFDVDGLLVDAVPEPGYDVAAYRCPGIEPTRLIEEGDAVDLGSRRFAVLHLPGHSPGSIGLWDAADGTLLAGDAIYDGVLVDTIPGADIPAYVGTMRRLAGLPVRVVHGGHKPSFGRERMVAIAQDYLRTREK
ncbi:MBL fold metallo-hydrolase [Labrys wisconsinensis]|uniref:Glyoxylase-like metal-dependent hydrolase (Beta-lactamase superfamily II) n=1 Tax=Labrys wisconsinensis TaxID=425677 RepID=A0ABU0JI98_9HYPH|nr:MBL fold metallo-hydrolase [Labrys wisconsinensis]MDQ0472847.1 glyoxylase-like metal-dependent hydrolase (beta-lactamase superfamily II) [Labrys wisconsinensis]